MRNGLGNIFASIPSLHSRAGPIEEAAAMSNTRAGWRWRRPLTPALSPGRGSQYRATESRRKRRACNTDFSSAHAVAPDPEGRDRRTTRQPFRSETTRHATK